jgi:WD40 repeat protein
VGKLLLAGFFCAGFLSIHSGFASASDIGEIAERITVSIDPNDINDGGSGLVVRKENSTYTVLTNCHVVETARKYRISIYINGKDKSPKIYSVNASRKNNCLPGVDLATLKFTSSENVTVANLGDFNGVRASTKIYIAGWIVAGKSPACTERKRCYRSISAEIQGFFKSSDGYSFTHSGDKSRPGMSGGPILNEQGDLIGINGRAIKDITTGSTDNLGIPIDTYKRIASIRTPSKPPTLITAKPKQSQQANIPPSNNSRSKPIPITPKVATISSNLYKLERNLNNSNNGYYTFAIAISPDRQYIVTGSDGGTIKIWRLSDGTLLRTLTGHSELVESIAISPDSQTIVSGASGDSIIRVWRLSDGQLLNTLKGHRSSVKSVAISPDGQRIVSGSSDNTIKIWRFSDGELLNTLSINNYSTPVAISPNSQMIFNYGIEGTKTWRISDGEIINTFPYGDTLLTASDDTFLATTSYSSSSSRILKLYRLSDGKLIITLKNVDGSDSAIISRDSRTLITGGLGVIQVWRLSDGKLLQTLKGSKNSVRALAISSDGQIIVSGGPEKMVKIWRRSAQ